MIDTLPPQNLDYEQSILGGMILDAESREIALRMLNAEDFYKSAHQKIFLILAKMSTENIPVDLSTLHNQLSMAGEAEAIGGAIYLAYLVEDVPFPTSIKHYCETVKGLAHKRKVIEMFYRATQTLQNPAADSFQQSALMVNQLVSLMGNEDGYRTYKSSDLSVPWVDDLEDRFNKKQFISGVPCGYHGLDNVTAGFQPSTLNVIAARPSMGKTALSLGISYYAALKGYPVLFFSLEMSKEELYGRIMAMQTGIEMHNFKRGTLSQSEWLKITNVAGKHQAMPLFINDSDGLSYQVIRSIARMDVKRLGIKLIVIDHLGLVTGSNHHNRDREIGTYTRQFKGMAKELRIPVMLLSQLSRKVEDRNEKRPVLSDLRDSGNIEQDADTVTFIYRPAVYKADEKFPGHAELLMRKNRDGPLAFSLVKFEAPTATFKPLSSEEGMLYE